MNIRDPELVDRIAAEYVLGTLRGRARRHFERWLVSPQVGSMVKAWEERLAGLEPPVAPVSPPAAVWHGIEKRLGLGARGASPARWLAIAASLVFFAALGWLAVFQPWQPSVTQLAYIEESGTVYWQVELLGENEKLKVQVRTAHALDAGKAHELWILPAPDVNNGNPVSLGLLPTSGEQKLTLTAAQRAALAGAKQLAVSLEPAGGSPTGLPTGPVLHVAPLKTA
jgi:anti-sigma-K factor RskA